MSGVRSVDCLVALSIASARILKMAVSDGASREKGRGGM